MLEVDTGLIRNLRGAWTSKTRRTRKFRVARPLKANHMLRSPP
jgi:hypothetical protein